MNEYLLVHFLAFWKIFWLFGSLCGHLLHMLPFWYVAARKI
jgi:hypothetical protein